MRRLERQLRRIVAELDELDLSYALVGGLGVSVRAEPRFTRDIDIAISVEDDDRAEGAIRELQRRGYRLEALVEQESTGRLATARLVAGAPGEGAAEGPVVDLLFASSGIEREIVAASEDLEVLPGVTIPVATPGHLMAQKLLARDPSRPQDEADLVALLAVAGEQDIEQARVALSLIAERGFDRGRDLPADLDRRLDERRDRR